VLERKNHPINNEKQAKIAVKNCLKYVEEITDDEADQVIRWTL